MTPLPGPAGPMALGPPEPRPAACVSALSRSSPRPRTREGRERDVLCCPRGTRPERRRRKRPRTWPGEAPPLPGPVMLAAGPAGEPPSGGSAGVGGQAVGEGRRGGPRAPLGAAAGHGSQVAAPLQLRGSDRLPSSRPPSASCEGAGHGVSRGHLGRSGREGWARLVRPRARPERNRSQAVLLFMLGLRGGWLCGGLPRGRGCSAGRKAGP